MVGGGLGFVLPVVAVVLGLDEEILLVLLVVAELEDVEGLPWSLTALLFTGL